MTVDTAEFRDLVVKVAELDARLRDVARLAEIVAPPEHVRRVMRGRFRVLAGGKS